MRNPKDVLKSAYHFENIFVSSEKSPDFNHFFEKFLDGEGNYICTMCSCDCWFRNRAALHNILSLLPTLLVFASAKSYFCQCIIVFCLKLLPTEYYMKKVTNIFSFLCSWKHFDCVHKKKKKTESSGRHAINLLQTCQIVDGRRQMAFVTLEMWWWTTSPCL